MEDPPNPGDSHCRVVPLPPPTRSLSPPNPAVFSRLSAMQCMSEKDIRHLCDACSAVETLAGDD